LRIPGKKAWRLHKYCAISLFSCPKTLQEKRGRLQIALVEPYLQLSPQQKNLQDLKRIFLNKGNLQKFIHVSIGRKKIKVFVTSGRFKEGISLIEKCVTNVKEIGARE